LDLEIVFFKDNEKIVEYYSNYMMNKDKKIDEMLSQIGTSKKKDKEWFLKKMKTWGEKGDISTLGIGKTIEDEKKTIENYSKFIIPVDEAIQKTQAK
jgi:hypothetical protein